MAARPNRPLIAAAVIAAALTALPAAAQSVSSLRLRLHPYAAAPGVFPEAAQRRLEALGGTALTLTGTTRTGALDLALPVSMSRADAERLASRLRQDRSVLWAEPQAARTASTKLANSAAGATLPGRNLLVRLKDDAAPDWSSLSARFTAQLGIPVAVERAAGPAWLLTLQQAVAPDRLAALASQLQDDFAVQYADPVRRVYADALPNDPLLSKQWALTDSVSGVNASAAWDVQHGSAGVTVAVVDSGILPHPDLDGRVLPGYDFVSNPDDARDGDGRDADPRDEGSWNLAGECGGAPAQDSFFHGLFVSGLIAANNDNGIGIAGVDWAAKILPVRVLARCGGTEADVFEGMLWAAGIPIFGLPSNPFPARVINMSLGGSGSCSQAVQQAIDEVMALGAVVVVSAGNASGDALDFFPANCSGVITVGAHGNTGDRAGYSNYGTRLALSAPGGDGGDVTSLILSTYNDGTTVPGQPAYAIAAGTSFAAPLVSGTVSLMLARNPLLTPGRVHSLLQGTTRDFPVGTQCSVGQLCGSGMLDAGIALASTVPSTGQPPFGAVPVVEFYDARRDHYFMSADPLEISIVDRFMGDVMQRTGGVFFAYPIQSFAPFGAMPVCRFYAAGLIQSHFYTANPIECQYIATHYPGVWGLETATAFWIEVPDGNGQCLPGRVPVYRFFDNRQDANHRHTLDLSERRAMINRGWVPEGIGPNAVAFCSPI